MQNDLHLAPVDASFCVHKANRARFCARSRDGRDSIVTWEIVYNLEQRFLRETFIYHTKVSHQKFWRQSSISALCIFQKIVHFLYSYLSLLSAIELSMFLSDWSPKFRQKNNTILYLNLLRRINKSVKARFKICFAIRKISFYLNFLAS